MRNRTCVIVVENLPVPLDRHVWQQALALRDHGWQVLVICPMGQDSKNSAKHEHLEGIEIFRHPLREARSLPGYLREYSAALLHESLLLAKLYRRYRFSVIHACNPPDFLLPFCIVYKAFGVKLLFDQHDLSPEIMEIRSGRGLVFRALLFVEWCSFKVADAVLASNETFREIALSRGGKRSEQVNVVHTVPDIDHLKRRAPDRRLRGDRALVIGYIGIIGVQDGMDHLVRATEQLVKRHGLTDFRAIVVGDGPALAANRDLVEALGLTDHVSFTGYLSGEALWAQLSDFDIGIIPDPVNAFNDKISMNKVFEYSALGIPSVSYALTETRRLLGEAGTYAADPTPSGLADAIATLMRDGELRKEKARRSEVLAATAFSWEREKASLISAYDRLAALD
jgi:glycosyltransferase involved in cell wall biosynthesis